MTEISLADFEIHTKSIHTYFLVYNITAFSFKMAAEREGQQQQTEPQEDKKEEKKN